MFYIIEIQKNAQGAYSHLVYTAASQNEAESVYFGKVAYAATSGLPLHAVVCLTEDGLHHMSRSYRNGEASE